MDLAAVIQSVQYLLPLTIAIFGLCIFVFGFQSVKEPDYSYINNIVPTRKKKQQTPATKKNGIVALPKASPTPAVKSKVEATAKPVATAPAGKENAQPAKKIKKPTVADELADLEEGDWRPVPARRASNLKANNVAATVAKQQASPKKTKVTNSPAAAGKNKEPVLKEVQNKVIPEVTVTEDKVEPVAQKKAKKTSGKEAAPAPVLDEGNVPVENGVVEADTKKGAGSKPSEVVKKKVVEAGGVPDSPDLWEESKSRGNKKKARARKD